MELGAFSISLAVRDLEASRAFDEKLGFAAFHGEVSQGWLILGPESFMVIDPDGNPVLCDQHI